MPKITSASERTLFNDRHLQGGSAPRSDTLETVKERHHTPRNILAVHVGGTHVKVLLNGQPAAHEFASGPTLTARQMVRWVRKLASDWDYKVVSIGYPAPVLHGRPVCELHNLGGGWLDFDFAKAFSGRVRLINDALMQAIGSYRGGRMLLLGLGTGDGTALIVDGVADPMELGHLPYKNGRTFEEYLGKRGLRRLGARRWRRTVLDVLKELKRALLVEYTVLGGGNAHGLTRVSRGGVIGGDDRAFGGAFRLWGRSRADRAGRRSAPYHWTT